MFERFCELLIGNAHTKWDIARVSGTQDNTQVNFDNTVRSMISNLSGSRESYDNFINHMSHVKKPNDNESLCIHHKVLNIVSLCSLSFDGRWNCTNYFQRSTTKEIYN